MESYRTIVTIAAIAIATMTVSSMLAATASAISETGKANAQRQGSGVCNADQRIHDTGQGQADTGFHNSGVSKNFGAPMEGFVGSDTPCMNTFPQ